MIYFISGGCGDGSPVFRCDLNGNNVRDIVEWASGIWYFEIYGGNLLFSCFPYENSETVALIMQDLETGGQTIFEGYSDFALMGQYAVAQGDTLDAIDMGTGRVYHLTGREDALLGRLYSGDGCVYFRTDAQDGSFTLYRLTIENGSAAIGMVAQAGEET